MKLSTLLLIFAVFLIPGVLGASDCSSFCEEKDFDYGNCRAITSDGEYCDGNEDETVFSFEYCTNLDRCCCGNNETTGEDNDSTVEEESTSFFSELGLHLDIGDKSMPETIFWFLLVIVIILGVTNIVIPRKSKEDDEDLEELI